MSVSNLCHISTIFLITASFNLSMGVKINKLQVPEVIKHGASVILDCDFSLEDTEEDLVVKWYFNKNKTLVYQWIPELKPQGLGILKDRLNLEYAASVDANSVHRALHILKAVPDLSGDYTCSVSTLQSEDIRTKSMLVFVPEKELLLRRLDAEEGLMRVQCLANGVFPRPVMSLHSQEREIEGTEVSARLRGQLYEVSATATLLALKGPEVFSCELRIPQANYTVRRDTVFYPVLREKDVHQLVGDLKTIIESLAIVVSRVEKRLTPPEDEEKPVKKQSSLPRNWSQNVPNKTTKITVRRTASVVPHSEKITEDNEIEPSRPSIKDMKLKFEVVDQTVRKLSKQESFIDEDKCSVDVRSLKQKFEEKNEEVKEKEPIRRKSEHQEDEKVKKVLKYFKL